MPIIGSWLLVFRYAPDLSARSSVWRNHAGSLELRAAAISFLDISGSSRSVEGFLGDSGRVRTGLGEPGGGRPRTEPKPLEVGLCCHDNVPLRDKGVALVAGNEGLECGWGDSGCGSGRAASNGGEEPNLSVVGSRVLGPVLVGV